MILELGLGLGLGLGLALPDIVQKFVVLDQCLGLRLGLGMPDIPGVCNRFVWG